MRTVRFWLARKLLPKGWGICYQGLWPKQNGTLQAVAQEDCP